MVATFLLRQFMEILRTHRSQFDKCFKEYLITCTVEAYNKGRYTSILITWMPYSSNVVVFVYIKNY
jgi:hypothetical protein